MATDYIALMQAQVDAAVTAFDASDLDTMRKALKKAGIYAAAMPESVQTDGVVIDLRNQLAKLKQAAKDAGVDIGGGQAVVGYEFS